MPTGKIASVTSTSRAQSQTGIGRKSGALTLMAANRGEIALRILRAGRELNMNCVAIYSYEDRLSMHRTRADKAYQIGSPETHTPVGAYLAIDDIIAVAVKRGVAVIHPGYGFLSENATFARKVTEAGIAFVGPNAQTIEECGDKTKARAVAIAAGVPVVPGSDGPVPTVEAAKEFVARHGLPIIIKAANGGGGRGMRVVRDINELPSLFERARSESLSAFGDDTLFIEKLVERPRHIEVQILADSYGNVIHLFERDCSVQRRHQKVVEYGPSFLPPAARQRLLDDAVKLAKSVGYVNAGTVEFLVDKNNTHYFIEINPRVQVEHCVTEEITGVDIVASQIQIALGKSLFELGLTQESIVMRGFAIQCRITAEDPAQNFQPDSGRISMYRSPGGNGVRLDGGPAYAGAIVSPHYDSLLVKCITVGRDYDAARRKMLAALFEFRIRGVKNNIDWLMKLLQHETFVKGGTVWTTFIDDTPELFTDFDIEQKCGSQLMRYLGEIIVNGPQVPGQNGFPELKNEAVVVELPGAPENATTVPCLTGWRTILENEGPEAFCKAVRAHSGVLLTDTTWLTTLFFFITFIEMLNLFSSPQRRDAHQSILATRVRTIDIAKIAPLTSHALQNCFSLESWGGATFDVSLRFLKECPWDRLATLRRLVPNIPFQMLLRGANAVGYTAYPDHIVYDFCETAVQHGMDIFRVFDSLNYLDNLKLGIDAVKKAGGVVEAAISYTGDVSDLTKKRYNLAYYLDLTDKLVSDGIHILCIKDMAGLLKPKAAKMLIGAIRAKYPDLVLHLHTHDTAGTGLATYIAAVEAGVDVVDCAVDSMSGQTSQPSMGAFVGSVDNTGVSSDAVQSLSAYWEQIRLLYSPFESPMPPSDSSIYYTEMPGGQYTNLQFQSRQLGLGKQWASIKIAYAAANRLCGGITKVTPSSKVVGDFAQFMVAQNLTEEQVIERADKLNFPQSVVEYFQGYLGQPPYGFPEPLRSRILAAKGLEPVNGRPGASMAPINLDDLKTSLKEKFGEIRHVDVLSAAMYPKVFEEYRSAIELFGHIESIPTQYFLRPMVIGEEFTYYSEESHNPMIVKFVAVGPLDELTLRRDVFFTIDGEARVIDIPDKDGEHSAKATSIVRPKADPKAKGDCGAPMAGLVVDVSVKEGQTVKMGAPIAVLSAMKMETIVSSPIDGIVEKVAVKQGDYIAALDLIAKKTINDKEF
ncbi:pyruvate carboxylase [Physocladia obscura]|uniref:Pyruvate carboxylase n=1 Tax=Physocladia obscura TaxID=109957 RepID=A0AAD5T346_9FUNG|nr:pyruvate carboxylase [Physocladia obscura]